MKDLFTTGEAAEICRVSQQTIIRCFDSGRLKGFRVPGSKFRRIPRQNLVKFMRDNSIPLDNLDSGRKKVLIVDDDAEIVELIGDILTRDGHYEIRTASSGYEAGMVTQQFHPDLILLDYMLRTFADLVAGLRVNPERMKHNLDLLAGMVCSQQVMLELTRKGFDRDQAYQLVQGHARRAWEQGASFRELVFADPRATELLSREELEGCFDYRRHLKRLETVFERFGM